MVTTTGPKFALKLRCLILLLAVLAIARPASAQTQPIFPVNTFTDLGKQQIMATGDFNSDGQTDYATISPGAIGSTLTILLNQGTGIAPIAKTTTLSVGVYQLLAVDINKDKNLDLVASCSTGILVLLGNGDGTFQAPVFYSISGVSRFTAADLNGDGYPDIALIDSSISAPSTVKVLLNKGTTAPGTLVASNSSYPLSNPGALANTIGIGSGDFNGDGKQDIVVLGNLLTVYYGNGDGTLNTPQTPSMTLTGEGYFVAADLNHDGITDIAYIGPISGAATPFGLAVLFGNPAGTFTFGQITPLGLESGSPLALIPAGTINNGNTTVLAAVSDKTVILLGDGNGNFTQGAVYAVNGAPFPLASASGKTDLIFDISSYNPAATHNQIGILTNNGDGTFQGAPRTFPVGPAGFATADVNNDSLADILTIDGYSNTLVVGLGRGDGTVAVSSRVPNFPGKLLVTGDFNHDGRPDFAILSPGDGSGYPYGTTNSQAYVYFGNGNGTFQSMPGTYAQTPQSDLKIIGAANAVVGDFNSDGLPDLVVSYVNTYQDPSQSQGIIFVPGKGDGTFGTPITIASAPLPTVAGSPLILTADLNNDHKPDIIWNGSVYLGKGDGTFQAAIAAPGPVLAVGDLNGDGIPDAVIGASIYAGKGDGTFQTTPFYTASLPASATVADANISDINADGHPDLLLQYQLSGATTNNFLAVSFGDGKGNFTADTNTYYLGGSDTPNYDSPHLASIATLARLNNNAQPQANGKALDYLTWTNGGATGLLNQTNPAPNKPSLLPTNTTLAGLPANPAPTQTVSFSASVTGLYPTGAVTFTSGGTTLGTAQVNSIGLVSFTASFPTTGTYSVTAAYAGDSNNQPSTSTPVTFNVVKATPQLNLSAQGISSTPVTVGVTQQVPFQLYLGGYAPTGTVTFSVAGGSTIGTPIIINDASTLNYAFTSTGTYTVTATYAGDIANLPATSNSVTINVVPQDFALSASGNYASISAGQAVGATLTVGATQYGFGPTINFSCGGLTTGEHCVFSPSTITLPNNSYASSSTQLVIYTTGPTTNSHQRRSPVPLEGAAGAGLIFLLVIPGRKRMNHSLRRSLFGLLLAVALVHLTACSSGGGGQNGITPSGTQTITITAQAASGSPSHSVTIKLVIQ